MKQFFGYTPDGIIYWQFVMRGGFPDGCNLDDPNCDNELAKACIKSALSGNPDEELAGIVKYECACSPEVGLCQCYVEKKTNSYVSDGQLLNKPETDIVLDGQNLDMDEEVIKPAGTLFSLKVLGYGIPDGSKCTLRQNLLGNSEEMEITFNNGESTELTFKAPGPGIRGTISIVGKYVRHFRAFVRGAV